MKIELELDEDIQTYYPQMVDGYKCRNCEKLIVVCGADMQNLKAPSARPCPLQKSNPATKPKPEQPVTEESEYEF